VYFGNSLRIRSASAPSLACIKAAYSLRFLTYSIVFVSWRLPELDWLFGGLQKLIRRAHQDRYYDHTSSNLKVRNAPLEDDGGIRLRRYVSFSGRRGDVLPSTRSSVCSSSHRKAQGWLSSAFTDAGWGIPPGEAAANRSCGSRSRPSGDLLRQEYRSIDQP